MSGRNGRGSSGQDGTSVNEGRRHNAQNMQSRHGGREGRGMEKSRREHRSSSLLQSVSRSVSRQASTSIANEQAKPASKPAGKPILSLHKGVPLPWECPPCSRSRQITNSLPQRRGGARRTVEGGRVENRASRIDKPAPWRPTPRARYERELNSIEQKPMEGGCAMAPWPM